MINAIYKGLFSAIECQSGNSHKPQQRFHFALRREPVILEKWYEVCLILVFLNWWLLKEFCCLTACSSLYPSFGFKNEANFGTLATVAMKYFLSEPACELICSACADER